MTMVRVGHIGFINCHPLYYGLEQRGMLAEEDTVSGKRKFELIPGVPTELNNMLVQAHIDLGPISSIAYARNHRQLLLSRRLSISSFGAVDSIQVVRKKPLDKIRSIALTRQSATSAALLKTILKLRFKLEVSYGYLDSSISDALNSCDAVLVIGDQGLEALYFPRPNTNCYDLGQLWKEWTGLPMVYAVWAAREDFAYERGKELQAVEDELVECVDYGRKHHAEVVDSALCRSRLDRAALGRYFKILRYDFALEYQQGLQRFYELAYEAGELIEVPQLHFIDEVVAQ